MSEPSSPVTQRASTADRDAEQVRSSIRERAQRIEATELATARDRLGATDDLTPTQAAILEEMTAAIVDTLLGPPESALDDADAETLQTITRLFDPDD